MSESSALRSLPVARRHGQEMVLGLLDKGLAVVATDPAGEHAWGHVSADRARKAYGGLLKRDQCRSCSAS
jgi:hypothetical protein